MMIAIVLLIGWVSHISCQRIPAWSSYPRLLQPSVFQPQSYGTGNSPYLQNQPNFQAFYECIPQPPFSSSPFTPRTNMLSTSPSYPVSNWATSPVHPTYTFEEYSSLLRRVLGSQASFTSNMAQNTPQLSTSTIPNTTPSMSEASQSFETATYSGYPTHQFLQSSPELSTYPQIQTQFSTSPSVTSFATPPTTASNVVPSSPKAPRSIIPSPLTATIPLPYPYNDPFMDMFDFPEPTLKSVGCLNLSLTPYGTISETPLPDPSIPLPRSPFLPVSSPVSALAPPSSPYLPPATPKSSSSNFLRKVPVPPPFI